MSSLKLGSAISKRSADCANLHMFKRVNSAIKYSYNISQITWHVSEYPTKSCKKSNMVLSKLFAINDFKHILVYQHLSFSMAEKFFS